MLRNHWIACLSLSGCIINIIRLKSYEYLHNFLQCLVVWIYGNGGYDIVTGIDE